MKRFVKYLTTNADFPTFCFPSKTILTSSRGKLVVDR
jgi:hypothetical protein